MTTTGRIAGGLTAGILVLVLAHSSLGAPLPDVSIEQGQLLSSERMSRTVFRYTFDVGIENNGEAAENVQATATSTSGAVSIVDASLSIGSLTEGLTQRSDLTYILDLDRTVPFDPSALVWAVSGDLPLDDGSLEGLDRDGDGVRDDLQAWISNLNLTQGQRQAMSQAAVVETRIILSGSAAPSQSEIEAILVDRARAMGCMTYQLGQDGARFRMALLRGKAQNTPIRFDSAESFADLSAGRIYSYPIPPADQTSCD